MRTRRIGLLFGWIAATSLAMLLASQAVALVRDQVTDRPSRVATTLALATTTTTVPETTTSTQQPPATSASTTAPETTTTSQPEATTTSVPAQTTTSTTVTASQEATLYLSGGWAAVRCAGDDVILATYSPNPGYQVEIESAGPIEVEIEFEEAGGERRSKLEATCRDGVLAPKIEERYD
jgi:cytoskeletal protein RodZ